ncbi:MAG: Snf7 family protein [Candidatus Bathyarchaeia archaeon]
MAPSVRNFFGWSKKSLNEMLIESICELGKYYSRLELAYAKISKRERELFNECASFLSKGLRDRAVVYANEIAELRKVMLVLQNIQLSIEKAILRLETLKTVTPTLQDIKGVFGDVKNTLGLLAKTMPSLMPEINNFMNSINELLATTEMDQMKCEPIVVRDEATEAILEEALEFLKSEVERKIPEPPESAPVPRQPKAVAIKPRIALSVDGAEAYIGADGSVINIEKSGQSRLMEEMILDHIERNNGELNLSKCARELNMPPEKIIEIVESLDKRGVIRIRR